MADSYITREYLQKQFQNYSSTVKDTFAKKVDVVPEKIEYENAVDATVTNVKGALDKLMVKTDSELESPLTPNVQMGTLKSSYPKGTPLEEIIRDMLTEELPPVVTMSISPSGTLYDVVNDSISSLTINATVTKKTYDVASIKYYVNDVLVKENANCANGGSYPYIYNTTINKTSVIKVIITDIKGKTATATKTITFVGQSYYGIVEPTTGTVSEAIIKTLDKTLKNTNDFVYSNISCEYNKIVYCYPSELGKLSTIADEKNSFNYMESFECQNVTVDGIPYYAYVLIEPTGVDSAEITFK